MQTILNVWLKNVPQYTIIFCDLILVGILMNQLTIGLQSAIQAIGKIKVYQAIVGSIILLNLPIAYGLLKIGLPAYTVLISFSVIELVACGFRLYLIKRIAGLSITEYFKTVFLKEIFAFFILVTSCFLITHFITIPFRFLITSSLSVITIIASIYFTGLESSEKIMINTFFLKLIQKITKKSKHNLEELNFQQ